MDHKLTLRTSTDLMRLGETPPTLRLTSGPTPRVPGLSYLDSKKLERQASKEAFRVFQQQISDEADAQIYTNRLRRQNELTTESERIALDSANTRRSLSAECTRATAEGVKRLEDDCYGRIKTYVRDHSQEERELDKLVASGEISQEHAEFLKGQSLERVQMLIEGDKALSRGIAAQIRQFSLIAISGFKASSPEGDER
jgi:hypothetical protein